MTTGYERYSKHAVWETLKLKRESLNAARFDDAHTEQRRTDIIEWLDEALKTRVTRQPALYLSALDPLSSALNELPTETNAFRQYAAQNTYRNSQGVHQLEAALRTLPLPPPKDLKSAYVDLLDKEVQTRNERLDELGAHVKATEGSLKSRLTELDAVTASLEVLRGEVQKEREAIAAVAKSAEASINAEWSETFTKWKKVRDQTDAEQDTKATAQIALLAATTTAGEALAEHAAGDLSAADWYGRAKRERKAAQWIRAAAVAAFIFAGAVGYFIVQEAILNNFDLSVGGGILRASVAFVIGVFGALMLRESSRHFREADTAEDVALSLKALAPFYANSGDKTRLAARMEVGDAVLVKNVLSRFSHRDAAKHAGSASMDDLPDLVKEAAKALKLPADTTAK